MPALPAPPSHAHGASSADVVAWVAEHLGDLAREGADGVRPGAVRGGQSAADAALDALDITAYARRRSSVLPESARGATRLSPYIRHGLLPLPAVWDAVAEAPPGDRRRFRDELLWQEYARHLYARVGPALGRPLRAAQPDVAEPWDEPWPARMRCMEYVVGALHEDGWLVNQTRMWLASQWAVRAGAPWRDGEDEMFAHLLDGSRAANRLGWQWTVGTGSAKPYGFSRWQVEKRAPELCRACPLASRCPIQGWPDPRPGDRVDGPDLEAGPVPGGPEGVEGPGAGERVWLTAESLGTSDPALVVDDARPAVFVFERPPAPTAAPVGQAPGLPRRDPRRARRLPARWTDGPAWRCRGIADGSARDHLGAGAGVGAAPVPAGRPRDPPVAVAGPATALLGAVLLRLAQGKWSMSRVNEHGQPIGDPVPDWVPRPRPAPVTLVGQTVRLEPLDNTHADSLYATLGSPQDAPFWTYRPDEMPPDRAAMAAWLGGVSASPEWVTFVLVPIGGVPSGLATLMRIEAATGSVEVGGIIFARSLQRTRTATEAMVLLMRHVFDDLGYRRYEWKLDACNAPSASAARRLGFRYEGRFRNALVYKGRNRDTDWFAMTDDDFARLRPAYDVWLDPANFDADGRQRRSLSDLTAEASVSTVAG